MHLPSEAAAGKETRGGTTVWVDSRRKGAEGAAANLAPAAAHKQRGSSNKSNCNGSCDVGNDGNYGSNSSMGDRGVNNNGDDDGGDDDGFQMLGTPIAIHVRQHVSRTNKNNSPAPPQPSRVSFSHAAPAALAPAPTPAPEPEPTGDVATTPELATAALLGATACQRRGRAQKKRARKVKDKMRQLCLEVSTTTPVDTQAAGVAPWPRLERAARELGELAMAKAQLAESKATLPAGATLSSGAAESGGGARNLATACAASPCDTAAESSSMEPPPPLSASSITCHPRVAAASEDGTASTAKDVGREAAFAAGNPKKCRATALIAEGAQEGRSSGDGEGSYSSSGINQPSASAEQFASHRKTRRGKRAGGAINRRRRAKEMSVSKFSATAAVTRATEGRVFSHTVAAAASERVVGTRNVGAKDDGSGVGEGREGYEGEEYVDIEAISIAAATVATAVVDTVADTAPPQAEGENNAQRETPKIKNGQEVEPQEHKKEQRETTAVVGLSSGDTGRGGREEGGVITDCEAEGCIPVTGCGYKNGNVFDGDGRRRGTAGVAAVVARGVAPAGASGRSELWLSPSSLPSPSLLAQDVAALERAALRSLLDLRTMCPVSACYSESASASTPVVPGCSQPSPPRFVSSCSNRSGATGATENKNSTANTPTRLRHQVRARGVLGSLVAICAPFPWTPVDPPLGKIPAVKEGQARRRCDVAGGVDRGAAIAATSSTNPAGAAAIPRDTMRIADSTVVGIVSGSASGKPGPCQPGVERAGPKNCEHDHHQHSHCGLSPAEMARLPRVCNGRVAEVNRRNGRAKQEGAGTSEDCDGGGREAMTESALAVLLAVLEEPSNREEVLKMDGGAPLVSRWRLEAARFSALTLK